MVLAESYVEDDRAAPAPEASGSRSRGLRIAVVASHTIEMVPWPLYEFLMDSLPDPTTIMIRRANKAPVAAFERLLYEVCRQSGHLHPRWMMPAPGGGGEAFNRDIEMVKAADLVLAFFGPHDVMRGGTGHVVEVAIDRNVPVYSFSVSKTEGVTRVGEHDPEAVWQDQVSEYFEKPDEGFA